MSKPKALVTRRWPEACEAKLLELFDVTFNADNHPMTAEELKDALRNYDVVMPTVTDPITADVLSAEPLRWNLGNFGVGFNHIDIRRPKRAASPSPIPPTCSPTAPPTSPCC